MAWLALAVLCAFSSQAATVTTDKDDYPPYSIVWITGAGFEPGETVSNVVVQIEGPDVGAIYDSWTVVADTNGNFETEWYVFSEDLADTTLQLTSTGESSGLQAQATFTDATRIWSGNVDNNWNNAANWDVIPLSGDNATIPAGRPNYPSITNFVGVVNIIVNGTMTILDGGRVNAESILAAGSVPGTVTDQCGNSATCTTSFTVENNPPLITTVTGPIGPLPIGSSATVKVNFTDPDLQGHMVTFSWDDSSANTIVSAGAGTNSGQASHTYTASGVYSVVVTVKDDCGDSVSTVFEFVVIYDPSGGFVTGGGWIDSPPGAYMPNASLVGKANFGFVSKYLKGATIPTGETEFQFKVADLNFHSTVYEWLVISGAKAQYKGSGTINGSGNYGFLLTATDGQVNGGGGVDKFRIKIVNKTTSQVVYDNGPGSDDINTSVQQGLAGGSIVLHK